ncbi:MAG: SAM-dependent methyltransferase [Bacteroidales bacterium]|nr:SAM-dependent methyltransferase [Bacteroidales bacterium]
MMTNEETLRFIAAHADDEVARVALMAHDPAVDMPFALQQIKGRQKAKEKLPDFFGNPDILYPPTVNMEQCSSTATAQYKASLLAGDTFADLSGGFGVDTLHLARQFRQGLYVEPNAELAELVTHNLAVLGVRNVTTLVCTMEEALPQLEPADWLYVDPSRRDGYGRRVVDLSHCVPDVLAHWPLLMDKARKGILLKLSPMLDIRQTLRQLPDTTDVQVVAVHGECKELLFMVRREMSPLTLTAVNLGTDEQLFSFTMEEEEQALPSWADGVGEWLYEPNVAIMKAGGYKTLTQHYAVRKLAPSTHLYTSEMRVDEFPGRIFRVRSVIPFHKQGIRQLAAEVRQANVAVRNFPLTADELRARLRVKDGGPLFLVGTTLAKGEKVLVVAEKG